MTFCNHVINHLFFVPLPLFFLIAKKVELFQTLCNGAWMEPPTTDDVVLVSNAPRAFMTGVTATLQRNERPVAHNT